MTTKRGWVAVLLGLLGCGPVEVHDHDHEDLVPTGAVCDSEQHLGYEGFGRAFVGRYCIGCHSSERVGEDRLGAPEEHNFDTLDLIREQASEIDGSTAAGPLAVNELMPVGTPDTPTLDDRMALGVWLACGAP